MTTTNHTSPSGEAAANGAIGEREAFETWFVRNIPDDIRENALIALRQSESEDGCYRQPIMQAFWEGWQGRASLPAEKVAQTEPVGYADNRGSRSPGDVMMSAHALCPDSVAGQPARMRWIADYFLKNYASPQPPLPVEVGETTYSSTQATNCAKCGEHKHTPLRIDWMGGYVCLTCIDKELEARVPAVVQDEQLDEIELCRHCDLPVEAPGYCVCNGARYEREHRAASPQATAPQPAQSPDGRVIDKAMVKRLAVQHGLLPAQPSPTEDIRKLIECAADCISEAVAWEQSGFDTPPMPATEWDYNADQLAYALRALLTAAQPASGADHD